MAEYILNNGEIQIKVDSHGAELRAVTDVKTGKDYMWNADPTFWGRVSPVLFPVVGSYKDGESRYQGQTYKMSQHGFARDSEFEFLSKTENSISFILKSNDETLKVYPYDFEFIVTYTLEDNRVIVSNLVKNTGNEDMYFYVGGHPAFNCPIEENLEFSDFYVEYEKNETIIQPLPDGTSRVIIDGENKYALSRQLFDYDVIMKDKPASKSIALKSDKSDRAVTVEFPESDCIAVWSPTGDDNATFVCLEPWTSVPTYADDEDFAIENKKHAIKLSANECYDYKYTIKID